MSRPSGRYLARSCSREQIRRPETNAIFAETIIEIRPFRNGWHVYDFAPAAKATGTVAATEMPVVLTFVGV